MKPGVDGPRGWVVGLRKTGAETLRRIAPNRYPDIRFYPVLFSGQISDEPRGARHLLLNTTDLSLSVVGSSGEIASLEATISQSPPDVVILLARHTANPEATVDGIARAFAAAGCLVISLLAGSFLPEQVKRSLRNRNNPCPGADACLFCLPAECASG